MQFLKSLNLIIAFLLELAMFSSISYWGFQQGKSTFTKWTLAIVCLAITIALWGILAAPNSQTRLSFPIRLIFEISMFLLASFLLYKLNYTFLAICFALLSIASLTVAYIFRQ